MLQLIQVETPCCFITFILPSNIGLRALTLEPVSE